MIILLQNSSAKLLSGISSNYAEASYMYCFFEGWILKESSISPLLFIFATFRANEEFNNAVVLTSRHLDANELLEVRVDKHLTKWAGSLEIGVTTHDPETLEFPSTMTNVQPPGTWMMSGGSIVCDGVTSIEEYGPTLDEIKVKKV